MDLAALRAKVRALMHFQRRPRPPNPESFAAHVDQELHRVDQASRAMLLVIKDLDARLTALGG